ncbi:MAG: hypothetical protein IKM88_10580, partial [Lachnospiraceae bacterium]|nr:hypothetical protein [Lachnospiraceae bacterium]
FEEFGKLQLEMAEDSKNSDTYKFFKMALHNMEVLKNIRKDINALERTGEDEYVDDYGHTEHIDYVQISQVNDILDLHLDQDWFEKPDIPMCKTGTPGFAENETGRVTLWHCSLYDELVADLSIRDKDGRYNGSIAASVRTNIPNSITVKEADKMAKYALKVFCEYKESTSRTTDKSFIEKCFIKAMAETEEHFHVFNLDEEGEKDI